MPLLAPGVPAPARGLRASLRLACLLSAPGAVAGGRSLAASYGRSGERHHWSARLARLLPIRRCQERAAVAAPGQAREHGQSAPALAAPQLGSCASSGSAWRLWAARHSQEEAGPLSAQPLPRLLEPAASKAADFTAFAHSGTGRSTPSWERAAMCGGTAAAGAASIVGRPPARYEPSWSPVAAWLRTSRLRRSWRLDE